MTYILLLKIRHIIVDFLRMNSLIDDNFQNKSNLEERLTAELAPFSLQELPINYTRDTYFPDIYEFHQILGAGGFGVVIAAFDRANDKEYAIKIVSKDLAGEFQLKSMKREAESLSKMKHKNIVAYKKIYESTHHQLIVMELGVGSLYNLITYRANKGIPLTEQNCINIMRQIFEGLVYLHKNNLLHRDLKLENILLRSFDCLDNSVLLADFGLSLKLGAEPYNNPEERCGTMSYMAPEILKGQKYSFVIFYMKSRRLICGLQELFYMPYLQGSFPRFRILLSKRNYWKK